MAAVIEDLDATRRTFRPREDGASDETRRTARLTTTLAGPTRRGRRGRASARVDCPADPSQPGGNLAAFSIAHAVSTARSCCWLGILYWRLGADRRTIFCISTASNWRARLKPNSLPISTRSGHRWTELSKGNPSSFLLHGPRKVVKQKFVAAADHVIDTYRNNESQLVYEKEWERARTMAARALAVDPEDTVRGKLRLCEGHLARINGTSHRSAQELNLAVEKFNEAQRLLPKSPDPELGLARVYVYGLKDIDKGYDALQQAQKRGYTLGNREKTAAGRWLSRSRRPPLVGFAQRARAAAGEGPDPEAADDYKRAEESVPGASRRGASRSLNLVRVRLSLESVNFRLHQIEHGRFARTPVRFRLMKSSHYGSHPQQIRRARRHRAVFRAARRMARREFAAAHVAQPAGRRRAVSGPPGQIAGARPRWKPASPPSGCST